MSRGSDGGRLSCWCIVAVLVLIPVGRVPARECFYVLIFASQRTPNEPDYSHTFATFVRATWPGEESCPQTAHLEAHTISWLPRTMRVRVVALHPECGHNFALDMTIRHSLETRDHVSLWGPYQTCPELYQLALRQIARLESGQVSYKAMDLGYSPERVCNCIHAVEMVTGVARLRIPKPAWGDPASYQVVQRFLPWIIEPDLVYPWVASSLGLYEYPILHRDWRQPPRKEGRGP
jgi:hypothetical protein